MEERRGWNDERRNGDDADDEVPINMEAQDTRRSLWTNACSVVPLDAVLDGF